MEYLHKIQDEINYWIDLEKQGFTLEDNDQFIFWINKDKRNKIAFDTEKELRSQITALPKEFINELYQDIEENKQNEKSRKKLYFSITSIASAACILLVAYFSFFMNKPSFEKDFIASDKIRQKILLPDNTAIALDTHTQINVQYYKDKRAIKLSEGKAFFEVSSNKKRPFIVKTNRATIKVLGTKFEVVNTQNLEVNVLEGKVAVWNKHDKLIAMVTKDQSLKLNKYLSLDSLEKTDSIAPWKEGKLSFHEESLKNVLNEFSKYIDINVEIENESIENLPISGKFTSKELDKVIKALPLIYPLSIEKSDKKIIIKQKI